MMAGVYQTQQGTIEVREALVKQQLKDGSTLYLSDWLREISCS